MADTKHKPKAIWDPDIAGLAIEISNQYVIWARKSEQGEKTFEDTKLRIIRAMISQHTTTEVARLEAEKTELYELQFKNDKEYEDCANRAIDYLARIERLEADKAELMEALTALGVMPDGYCFCHQNRDPLKTEKEHTGECRDARAAIAKAEPS